MATGQYLTEVAAALAEQGNGVTVVTSNRAYDDPARRFPARETWKGIEIYRVGSTAFGKTAKWRRAADFASFIVSCVWRLVLLPRHDAVVALTTPPLISFIGACLAWARGSRFIYWVMDMNPDEAIAAGWLRKDSLAARVLEWMSRFSFRHASKIIALDRFMAERIQAKGIPENKIVVVPPWSHDEEVFFDASGRDAFRKAHGLEDKFVVMYSGNHSPVHPLDTLLAATRELAAEPDIAFCFVGGGSEWRKIKERLETRDQRLEKSEGRGQNSEVRDQEFLVPRPSSLVSPPLPTQVSGFRSQVSPELSTLNPQLSTIKALPYQPLSQLSASLSAADLHVVVMGNEMLGLVHPCKIYNILSVGAPVLYIGPDPSHVTEIFKTVNHGPPCLRAAHGDVSAVVNHIRLGSDAFHSVPNPSPSASNDTSQPVRNFSQKILLPKILSAITSATPR